MRIRSIELLTAIGLTIAAILTFAKGALANDIMVMDAVAPKSLTPNARTGAVFMSIMNHGGEADTLLSMSSPAAEIVELHQNIRENGIVKMRSVASWPIAAGTTLNMLDADIHIMLVGLKAPLKPGDTFELVMVFDKAGTVNVQVPVSDKAAISSTHDHGNMETTQ